MDEEKIILPFFFLFILNDHPLGVFFSHNVLVKKLYYEKAYD